jgi:RNA polymerase sigma-70 factor (ECF subfamily)
LHLDFARRFLTTVGIRQLSGISISGDWKLCRFSSLLLVFRLQAVQGMHQNHKLLRGTAMSRQQVTGMRRLESSEDDLIRASQRGDTEASETLFRRYHRPLFQTALRVTRNVQDAEDAVQDGLLSAYRNLNNFERRSQFCTWLTRIVINAALMRRRKIKARPLVLLEDMPQEEQHRAFEVLIHLGPNPEEICAGRETEKMVKQGLRELSPLLRSAFALRGLQGYSTREAARTLGVTENTFKARLWRARHQLACRMSRLSGKSD